MLGGFCFSFVYLLVIKEQVAIFNEFVMRMLDKSYDVTTVWMLIRLFIQMCFQFLSGKWTVKIQNNPKLLIFKTFWAGIHWTTPFENFPNKFWYLICIIWVCL